jgi:hypothetical protein
VAALGVECVSSFAVDFWLQTHLFQAGILWHLLGYLFNYDYTLEESGIQKSEETNQQVTFHCCNIELEPKPLRLMLNIWEAKLQLSLRGDKLFSR